MYDLKRKSEVMGKEEMSLFTSLNKTQTQKSQSLEVSYSFKLSSD